MIKTSASWELQSSREGRNEGIPHSLLKGNSWQWKASDLYHAVKTSVMLNEMRQDDKMIKWSGHIPEITTRCVLSMHNWLWFHMDCIPYVISRCMFKQATWVSLMKYARDLLPYGAQAWGLIMCLLITQWATCHMVRSELRGATHERGNSGKAR